MFYNKFTAPSGAVKFIELLKLMNKALICLQSCRSAIATVAVNSSATAATRTSAIPRTQPQFRSATDPISLFNDPRLPRQKKVRGDQSSLLRLLYPIH